MDIEALDMNKSKPAKCGYQFVAPFFSPENTLKKIL